MLSVGVTISFLNEVTLAVLGLNLLTLKQFPKIYRLITFVENAIIERE